MGGSDIEALLQNGYWSKPKANSLDSRNISDTLHHRPAYPTYTTQDGRTIPRTMIGTLFSQKPPPPSVEDEYDALAKEAGSAVSSVPSEEPLNRGDPDQYPIIVPVQDPYEQNPERRFVLLSKPSNSSLDIPPYEQKPGYPPGSEPDPASYEANTGRKYGSPPSSEDRHNMKETTRPDREHRRSRPEDLPPIITDDGSEGRAHEARRAKSTARTEDYDEGRASPRPPSASSRHPRESMPPPEVIEYGKNGRERPYHKGGSSPDARSRHHSAHASDPYGQRPVSDRRYKERGSQSGRSPSPTSHQRHKSENPKYTRRDSKEGYDTFRLSADALSSKPNRKMPSKYSQSDRDVSIQHSPIKRDRRVPPLRNDSYSSEEEPRSRADSYRRSAMPAGTGKTDYLDAPIGPRGATRHRSRGRSPLHTPRDSQIPLSDSYSSSSSTRGATFPKESRSPVRAENPQARSATGTSFFSSSSRSVNQLPGATVASPSVVSSASGDARRVALPPQPRVSSTIDPRVSSSSVMDPRGQPATPSTMGPTQANWPPPQLDSTQISAGSNAPSSSYTRYSAEGRHRGLADIPSCPRTREETGHVDWLTLYHCDNFNICPSCYTANFAATEFAHHFVPLPFRSRDRPQACDFGTSEYYRIAWLFTRKYGRTDLGLFHGLARIAAQVQRCAGPRPTSRIWYSIRDPRTRRPLEEFAVCAACAKTVELLLPALTGLFVPLDNPAEPTRGVCAMHQDDGHYMPRGRFPLYFDLFESTVDRALDGQTPPNVQALADRVSQITAIPPCEGRGVLRNAYWHTMRGVPGLLVCPECFAVVVRPLLDDAEADLTVVGNFHHVPTLLSEGECMLFSDRMRDVFHRAVRKRDLGYLDAKVGERISKERECNARLEQLRRQGLDPVWVKAETDRIFQEWRRYE
ncbi:hypothetical protein GGR50DRAFT_299138 [Xylaria sp. CBS 124048]|nr:hypothetical protein GGR50DRAFT_299138 [Xylaria sp. CBS 124048]